MLRALDVLVSLKQLATCGMDRPQTIVVAVIVYGCLLHRKTQSLSQHDFASLTIDSTVHLCAQLCDACFFVQTSRHAA
jgi:hypothetical protein